MSKFLSIAVAVSLLLIPAPHAYAHAQFATSFPAKNKVINKAPQLVWIEFDDNLIEFPSESDNKLTVLDSKNRRVDLGATIVGGARISIKIKSKLNPGRYLVKYRVVSGDGHPVRGEYSFWIRP